MAKYGLWSLIDNLAEGDLLKWDGLVRIDNNTMLVKYSLMADQAWIEEQMKRRQ